MLKRLEAFQLKGGDAAALANEAIHGRIAASIEDSTRQVYFSHVNMVEWACRVFNGQVCPTELPTIRRVAMICNNPQTLKGWLASWRHLHLQRGNSWQGDADPMLKPMRTGTLKALPDAPPKRRIRRPLLRKLLKAGIKRDLILEGGIMCLAYVFALRIPSELLSQGRWEQFKTDQSSISIIPLKRKLKRSLTEDGREFLGKPGTTPQLGRTSPGGSGLRLLKPYRARARWPRT